MLYKFWPRGRGGYMAKKHFVIAGFLMATISFFAARRARQKKKLDAAREDAREMKGRLHLIKLIVWKGGSWKGVPPNIKIQFLKRVDEKMLPLKKNDPCPIICVVVHGYACYLIDFVPYWIPAEEKETKE